LKTISLHFVSHQTNFSPPHLHRSFFFFLVFHKFNTQTEKTPKFQNLKPLKIPTIHKQPFLKKEKRKIETEREREVLWAFGFGNS
jgi:hypothetical protein